MLTLLETYHDANKAVRVLEKELKERIKKALEGQCYDPYIRIQFERTYIKVNIVVNGSAITDVNCLIPEFEPVVSWYESVRIDFEEAEELASIVTAVLKDYEEKQP